MAFKDVASSFVRLSCKTGDPTAIPQHYAKYYDRAYALFQKFGHYGGVREIPHNDWPIICLLADQEMRIEALEARLMEAARTQKPVSDFDANGVEEAPRIDMRTREGRALKMQMAMQETA